MSLRIKHKFNTLSHFRKYRVDKHEGYNAVAMDGSGFDDFWKIY